MILIVGSIIAVYSIPRDSINQWSAGTDVLGLTLQTDGALVGQVDNANDLGSSTYEFKDGYFDGTIYVDTLDVDGALLESVTILTVTDFLDAAITLTPAQGGFIVVKSSDSVTLTLPAASTNAGLSYTVLHGSSTIASADGAITVTLDGNASETIDGATTDTDIDAYYDVLKITCDGTEWYRTGGNIH